ncbi:MAG: hypothetical protein H0W72_12455 [Planctomycetes bacterium]|nr:hypothetical protein [Planctomycetota bacterium]
MSARMLVLVNAVAGTGSGPDAIGEAFARCDLTPTIRPLNEGTIARLARGEGDAWDVVVAAGGDGTVASVAHALIGRRAALGVLPTGTLNHFARDLGLPLELPAAVAAVRSGVVRVIDVGEVNGRIFINNSSVGLYPSLLQERDRERRTRGRRKYPAMAVAMARAVRRFPNHRVRLAIGGKRFAPLVPFVFVANNGYSWKHADFARRPNLDGGRLYCYVPPRSGRRAIARLMAAWLFDRVRHPEELVALPVERLQLDAAARSLAVALDGEVFELTPPLKFRIRHRALRVIVPDAA